MIKEWSHKSPRTEGGFSETNVAPWEKSVHAGPKVDINTRSTINIHESLHELPRATLQSAQSPHLARRLQSLGVAQAIEE